MSLQPVRAIQFLTSIVVVAVAAALLLSSPEVVQAANFTVDSEVDSVDVAPGDGTCEDASGRCTLRAAVMEANSLPGADRIDLPAGTYELSLYGFEEASATGDLDITDDLVLLGAGASSTIIDAEEVDENIFEILGGPSGPRVEIAGVTVQNGDRSYDSGSGSGGGIRVGEGAALELRDSVIRDNTATDDGGGILSRGTLTVIRSTIVGNSNSGTGGGIAALSATIVDSLFIDNSTLEEGDAISAGQLTLLNSTVSANGEESQSFGAIGVWEEATIVASTIAKNEGFGVISVYTGPVTVTVRTSIIADNARADCSFNDRVTPVSLGHNLTSDDTCGLTAATDQPNTDPLLGPLEDNGGPTSTHALLPGSPALDAVSVAACVNHEGHPLPADQRGVARPQGPNCDIGAFEVVQVPLSFTVDSTADSVDKHPGNGRCADQYGRCTLRAAVMEANASLGRDTIHLPAGTYELTLYGFEEAAATGDLDITSDLVLLGAGAGSTIIDADQVDENIFEILGGPSGSTVEIAGVTVQNGRRSHDSGNASGGGIRVGEGAALELRDSVIRDNTATDAGGGIVSSGTLTVIRSTLIGNHSWEGGGIAGVGATVVGSLLTENVAEQIGDAISGGELIVVNTTVSRNGSGSSGAGAINVWGSALIVASTVADNDGAGVLGFDGEPSITFQNTVIANNGTRDCLRNIVFPIVSLGHNLDSDDTCGLTAATDRPNTDPLLGLLEDNGGPTSTHALLPGSPGLDAVPVAACVDHEGHPLSADQRGVARPQGPNCDIGAFEVVQVPLSFTVDSTVDSVDKHPGDGRCADKYGRCTLRAAVMEANASLGRDTIDLPAGTYELTLYGFAEEAAATGDLDITDDLVLLGAGAGSTVIDADQVDENIFDIRGGLSAGPTVEIAGVTVQNGDRSHDSGNASGGGIRVGEGAALELRDSVIRDNTATNEGGGILSRGTLTVIRSTFVGNRSTSGSGGGITARSATVVDSLFTGNSAYETGDAILAGQLTLENSTVSANGDGSRPLGAVHVTQTAIIVASTIAENDGFGVVSGHDGPSTVSVRTSIIADNARADCALNDRVTPVSLGHNLTSDDTCGLTAATDRPNTDPLLGPLEDNGGPTSTHALLPGSPALDAVPVAACVDHEGHPLPADQRGVARPQGPNCDIGAFELKVVPPTPTPTPTPSPTATPTPTPSPTATPTPTPSPTATPTPTPSPTATPAPPSPPPSQGNAPTIVANLEVLNDDGGAAGASDFEVLLDGEAVELGEPTEVGTGLKRLVLIGPINLYAATFAGDCDSSGFFNLALGEHAQCDIVADDQPLAQVLGTPLPGAETLIEETLSLSDDAFEVGGELAVQASTAEQVPGLVVTVPLTAVPAQPVVTVSVVAGNSDAARFHPLANTLFVEGTAYTVEVLDISGDPITTFASPITLSFALPEGVDGGLVAAFFFDAAAAEWTGVTNEVVDGRILVRTVHLSTFALFEFQTDGGFGGPLPATGVALALADGGTVTQLESALREVGAAAVFVTEDGAFVGYRLGAPSFVNAAFRELFAGGLSEGRALLVVR